MYQKSVLAFLIPIGLVIISGVFWGLLGLRLKNGKLTQHAIVTIVIMIFLVIPFIGAYTFTMFSCADILAIGESNLQYDVNVLCWTGQ